MSLIKLNEHNKQQHSFTNSAKFKDSCSFCCCLPNSVSSLEIQATYINAFYFMIFVVYKLKYHTWCFHSAKSRLLFEFWNNSIITCTHINSTCLKVNHHTLPFTIVHYTLESWTNFDASNTLLTAFYPSNSHEFSKACI